MSPRGLLSLSHLSIQVSLYLPCINPHAEFSNILSSPKESTHEQIQDNIAFTNDFFHKRLENRDFIALLAPSANYFLQVFLFSKSLLGSPVLGVSLSLLFNMLPAKSNLHTLSLCVFSIPPIQLPSCFNRQNNSMFSQLLPASMHLQMHQDAQLNISSPSLSPSLEGVKTRQGKNVFLVTCECFPPQRM